MYIHMSVCLSRLITQIFLRELISNASDALDKIRFLSLTDKSALSATEELSIKIKADKENKVLHITDTGIGKTIAILLVMFRNILRNFFWGKP